MRYLMMITLLLSTYATASIQWENGMYLSNFEYGYIFESRMDKVDSERLYKRHPERNKQRNEVDRRELKQQFSLNLKNEIEGAKKVQQVKVFLKVKLDDYDFDRNGFPVKGGFNQVGKKPYMLDIVNAERVNFIAVSREMLEQVRDGLGNGGLSRIANLYLDLVLADGVNPIEGRNKSLTLNARAFHVRLVHKRSKLVLANYDVLE